MNKKSNASVLYYLVHKCLDVDIGEGGHKEHAVTPKKEFRKEDTS